MINRDLICNVIDVRFKIEHYDTIKKNSIHI